MDLFDAIHSRRTVRKYSQKKIPKQDLKRIVDAATFAPSACNIQGWRFIIVDDHKMKQRLVERGAASFLANSPCGVLVLYDNQTDNLEYMDHLQSAAACIQNMLLAAHCLGIGGCWICHLPRRNEVRDIFHIPGHYDPVAYVALGYPDGQIGARKRKHEVDELISYNKYKFKGDSGKSILKLSIKRMLRGIYFRLPFRKHIKKRVDDLFEKRFD